MSHHLSASADLARDKPTRYPARHTPDEFDLDAEPCPECGGSECVTGAGMPGECRAMADADDMAGRYLEAGT